VQEGLFTQVVHRPVKVIRARFTLFGMSFLLGGNTAFPLRR
jgi:hypothetical protein